MKRFHVTYRYLATGMEGRADEHDYGIFEAADEADAKGKAADAHCKGDSDTRHFFIGCLTAHEMVAHKIETAKDPNGNWYVMVDGKMDTNIPYASFEKAAVMHALAMYPGCTVIGTESPDHYSNQRAQEGAPIDMTPTWGEMGTLLCRLVRSNEVKALKIMWPEVAKVFAMAQAVKEVMPTLHPDTQATMRQIMQDELRKQQQAVPSWAKGD